MDDRLKKYLEDLVARSDESGAVEVSNCSAPEYRELKRLGMFEDTREYIDMTASVTLSYKAMSISEKEAPHQGNESHSIAKTIAGIAGTFTGAAIKELNDQ